MKIFDRDGDGDFDIKDVLIFATLLGTTFNLFLNMFALLNLGVSFTVQDSAVLNCGVVNVDNKRTVKCIRPSDQLLVSPDQLNNVPAR